MTGHILCVTKELLCVKRKQQKLQHKYQAADKPYILKVEMSNFPQRINNEEELLL